MKVEELSIGDWVIDGENIAQITSITCDGILETTFNKSSNIEVIKPITLTSEILEKNGFTKRKDGSWAIEKKRIVGCCGQTCSNTNPLIYVIWVDKGYMGVVNYQPEATITKAGSHVHELQQCIHISEIDKEIML